MIPEWQSRTELLIGRHALEILKSSHVLVAGLGGVGAYTAEMLCRAGIGRITIADSDRVQPSNRNRQLLALQSTEGNLKVVMMKNRLLDINPEIQVTEVKEFLNEENMDELMATSYHYIADAIDTLSPKLSLIRKVLLKGYPLVSSMGSGGKLDPSLITVCDIEQSHTCKFAYNIRKRLHSYGIRGGFKVVFSPEPVSRDSVRPTMGERNKKSMVGTISYIPPVFGCFMASVIIRGLLTK